MKYIVLLASLLTFTAHAQDTGIRSESATVRYKNGIIIIENGLKVSQAMLLDSTGDAIGDDNMVALGEDVLCRLFVNGWKDQNGRVKVGLSQTVETKEGEIIMEQDDLFSTLESASLEDAGVITARAAITELNEPIDGFIVKFKVWDKSSNASASGQYTFHVKNAMATVRTVTPLSSEGDIKNDIILNDIGLHVTKALLLHPDGSPASANNTFAPDEDVLCRLYIHGWSDKNGRVKIGARQTIKTADGTVILEQDDLFSALESISLEDAGVLTLTASITELKKSLKEFVVAFKVWDKISGADVTGEYKVQLR